MLALFGLGHMELLIVLTIGFCTFVVPVIVVVVVVVAVNQAGARAARPVPCPHCGAATIANADVCGQCGKPLR